MNRKRLNCGCHVRFCSPFAIQKGFTLIELLIVVGIISILALIAVPNFLEAQVRAKVAAVKSNMRVYATALESYMTDNNHYPSARGVGPYASSNLSNPVTTRLIPLTTPISYMSTLMRDQFAPRGAMGWTGDMGVYDTYDFLDADSMGPGGYGYTSGGYWRLASAGPDLYHAYGGNPVSNVLCNQLGVDYDPTNGTVSTGDLVRCGPPYTKEGNPQDLLNPLRPGVLRVPVYREQW